MMQSSKLDTPLQETNSRVVLKVSEIILSFATVLRMLNGNAKSGKPAAA